MLSGIGLSEFIRFMKLDLTLSDVRANFLAAQQLAPLSCMRVVDLVERLDGRIALVPLKAELRVGVVA